MLLPLLFLFVQLKTSSVQRLNNNIPNIHILFYSYYLTRNRNIPHNFAFFLFFYTFLNIGVTIRILHNNDIYHKFCSQYDTSYVIVISDDSTYVFIYLKSSDLPTHLYLGQGPLELGKLAHKWCELGKDGKSNKLISFGFQAIE